MGVDVTPWKEEPEENEEILGMSLAASAPVSNVAAMVAALMAAIKSGDLTDTELSTQIVALEEELDEKAPAFDSITNQEIYDMIESED